MKYSSLILISIIFFISCNRVSYNGKYKTRTIITSDEVVLQIKGDSATILGVYQSKDSIVYYKSTAKIEPLENDEKIINFTNYYFSHTPFKKESSPQNKLITVQQFTKAGLYFRLWGKFEKRKLYLRAQKDIYFGRTEPLTFKRVN